MAVLTPRESEVLELVAEGLTNPQIADRLYVSPQTIKFHVSRILWKLEVRTRTAAAAVAWRARVQEAQRTGAADA